MLSYTFFQGVAREAGDPSLFLSICSFLGCHHVLELVCALRVGSRRDLYGAYLSDYRNLHAPWAVGTA